MLPALFALAFLSAVPPAPATAAGFRVFVMDAEAVGIDDETAQLVTGLVTTEVGNHPRVDALAPREAAEIVALEAEKQALGCASDSSCLSELADALGAGYVVTARVDTVDAVLRVDLSLLDTAEARVLSRAGATARDLLDLGQRLPVVVRNLLIPLVGGDVEQLPPPKLGRRMLELRAILPALAFGALTTGLLGSLLVPGLTLTALGATEVLNTPENNARAALLLDTEDGLLARIAIAGVLIGVVPAGLSAALALGALGLDLVVGADLSIGRTLLAGLSAGAFMLGLTFLTVAVGVPSTIVWQVVVALVANRAPSDFDAAVPFLVAGAASTVAVGGVASATYLLLVGLFPDEVDGTPGWTTGLSRAGANAE